MGFGVTRIFDGVYRIGQNIATQNMVEGTSVYSEQRISFEGKEYRIWDPNRSKVGAAIRKGMKEFLIGEGSKVLYLGAAEGTTISHLSDIVGKSGVIFGVDISARSMRKFIYLCEKRPNIVPILGDASQPMTYKEHISGFSIDALVQDVSQKNQAEIFLKNARAYLKREGHGYLSIKARSISASESAESIFRQETKKMENEFEILETIPLEPFEKEHEMVVGKKK
ncbi:MAG: fibrillarin-like rRNA/tRNA 2'-O-methyltransferase [Candidatus Diapherotrites archaeon]|uniref:Fibrillarin-like rRNA/tRNA 2'-O-methyltransferase n=1 Tax=Candidatus Iainarchaeum sp. TaxID=3101447 RepID=A0A8T3YNF7_9ARCH|nr:fibrillarin-like rRNA/tRNA 2'-O-methyltransferase [Candidatus Diapherotrites archaeon]